MGTTWFTGSQRKSGARHTGAPRTPTRRTAHQQSVTGEPQPSSVVKIALQPHRRLKHQPETRPTNTRDNKMAKGKRRNTTNRNLGNMTVSEPNSSTTACPGYHNTSEKKDLDLKSLVMMLLKELKKDINESLKEIQGNMNKLETHIMETQKSLKEMQENKAQETEANKEEMQKNKTTKQQQQKQTKNLKKCRRT